MKNKIIISFLLLIVSVSSSAQHFQTVWQTPFNPMNIYVLSAKINGLDLGAGDEIGVFDITDSGNEICVGALILDAPITPGGFVQIICSMNDGTTPGLPNGFTSGNPLLFRFYDQDSGTEIADIQFYFPYPGYAQTFTPLGTAIVDLEVTTQSSVNQIISLNSGWTAISSYLIPENPTIANVVSQVSGFVILKDLLDFYIQGNPNNSLTIWNHHSGYFIKTQIESEMIISGFLNDNLTLQLTEGWNLIPVMASSPVDIDSLFEGQMGEIEIIKEAIGLKVNWPEYAIETLQVLMPGCSYLIKAKSNVLISFD